jgi:hypothetical protein
MNPVEISTADHGVQEQFYMHADMIISSIGLCNLYIQFNFLLTSSKKVI